MTALAIVTSTPALLALAVALGLRWPGRRRVPSLVRRLAEYELDDYTWREFMRSLVDTRDDMAAVRVHIGATA